MGVFEETKSGMEKAIEHLKDEFNSLRSNRPNPSVITGVVVEVYGAEMRLRDLANVGIDGRQLVVTPFDPQTAGPISKGIERANLNLQPMVDGNIVRVPIPPMNEELRRDITKQAKKKAEDAKVSIRDHRRKGNDILKKQKSGGEINEDEQKKTEKRIQELTDQYCKEADTLLANKEKDVMEV